MQKECCNMCEQHFSPADGTRYMPDDQRTGNESIA